MAVKQYKGDGYKKGQAAAKLALKTKTVAHESITKNQGRVTFEPGIKKFKRSQKLYARPGYAFDNYSYTQQFKDRAWG